MTGVQTCALPISLFGRSLPRRADPSQDISSRAVAVACDRHRALSTFNQLGLLAVPSDAHGQKRRLRHHARLNVRRLLESESTKGVTVTRIVLEGGPFVEIAKTARLEKVDLVVMGSYGGRSGNVDKIFFGSTAEKVVRTAGCPVLTVPLPPKPKR